MRTANGDLLPDLVIGGIYKCGTTSLFDWLARHPAIVASRPKEPNFLRDDPDLVSMKRHLDSDLGYWSTGLKTYGRCWPRVGDGSFAMEGTPFYVFSRTAKSVLSSFEDPPVFVVLVRRPSMRVRSIFNAAKYKRGRLSHETTFPHFVDQLLSGSDPNRYDAFPQLRSALSHSDYPTFLDSWAETYPGVFMVVQMERMIREPALIAREICAELGIEDHLEIWDDDEIINSNPGLDVRSSRRAQVIDTGRGFVRHLPRPLRSRTYLLTPHLRAWALRSPRVAPLPVSPEDDMALQRLDDRFDHVASWMASRSPEFRPELWS